MSRKIFRPPHTPPTVMPGAGPASTPFLLAGSKDVDAVAEPRHDDGHRRYVIPFAARYQPTGMAGAAASAADAAGQLHFPAPASTSQIHCALPLVPRVAHSAGYSLFSFTRAS